MARTKEQIVQYWEQIVEDSELALKVAQKSLAKLALKDQLEFDYNEVED